MLTLKQEQPHALAGNITRDVTGKLSGGFFSVPGLPGLADAQHEYSAIIAADLLLCQRRTRFRFG